MAALLIMAAGLGTRYGGSKQTDGIGPNGELLMQYSIYDAINAGFDKIVLVIKPEHRKLIEGLCKGINAEIVFAYQDHSTLPESYEVPKERTKPFGTVHALLCARDCINEPFAVINADDYYGAEAYGMMLEKLTSLKENEGAMVSYRLKNTVSENGGVTRGLCSVENGVLRAVKETYRITLGDDGVIRGDSNEPLDPEALVSMNMWGFLPSVFDLAKECFARFLERIPQGEVKAEYALPTMVDELICGGRMKISALMTDARWFGVTYREDRETVASELKRLHDSGRYPEKLFC